MRASDPNSAPEAAGNLMVVHPLVLADLVALVRVSISSGRRQADTDHGRRQNRKFDRFHTRLLPFPGTAVFSL